MSQPAIWTRARRTKFSVCCNSLTKTTTKPSSWSRMIRARPTTRNMSNISIRACCYLLVSDTWLRRLPYDSLGLDLEKRYAQQAAQHHYDSQRGSHSLRALNSGDLH